MYIPKLNVMEDREEAVAFMKRFSFATFVTAKENIPVATHLPFLITIEDQTIILTSHFAKANEQWKDIETGKVLVIFTEPHAYISPSLYDKELNVPTWNYISVHAYGRGRVITELDRTMEILESTINNYEATYMNLWNGLPQNYKHGLANGIVAFRVAVEEIQGKKKLSQNKTEHEQENIIHSLSKSSDTNEQLIAEYMKHNGTNKVGNNKTD